MNKAVGYIRVSSVKQAQNGTSLDEQRAAVEAFCNAQGIELVVVVEDRGRSGTVKDGEVFGWESRPSLMQIMRRAEAGEFQSVVVAKLDRLSRDHTTTVAVRRMLGKHGVQLHSAGERNGDSAADRLQQGILLNVAEFEAELISPDSPVMGVRA